MEEDLSLASLDILLLISDVVPTTTARPNEDEPVEVLVTTTKPNADDPTEVLVTTMDPHRGLPPSSRPFGAATPQPVATSTSV
jgi:hypothetical protein